MASTISAGTSTGTALNLVGDTSGALALQTNNGTTALTIDTSQNVGIGTSSPASKLQVTSSTTNCQMFIGYTDNNNYYQSNNLQVFGNYNGSTATMTVDTGNQRVGIGTSTPGAKLGVQVSSGTGIQAYKSTTGGFTAYQLYTSNENVIGTVGVASTNDTFYLGYTSTPVFTWNQNCVGVGGAIPSTSGAGITFPATQSASSDANTLDDYEEGTWTPRISDGTNTVSGNSSTYTKIGRFVQLNLVLYGVNLSSLGSGGLKLSNLPFAVKATFTANPSLIGATTTNFPILADCAGTEGSLYQGSSGANVNGLTKTNFNNPASASLWGMIVYQADA